MQIYKGKSVFGGIAIGKISVYKKDEQLVKRVKIEDVDAEMERYTAARNIAAAQLQKLYDKALKEVGEANAAIFEVHQMMLEDEDYNESVENIIRSQMVNAEYAVASTADNFAQMFEAMDDDYMRGRAADVRDISERVITVLAGGAGGGLDSDEPVILQQTIWHHQKPFSWIRIRFYPSLQPTVQKIPIRLSLHVPWVFRH